MQVGSIGEIVFEVSSELVRTFTDFTEDLSARISSHEVGGSLPVLEWIGPGTPGLNFTIRLNEQLGANVPEMLGLATRYCNTGELLTVIIGGEPKGPAGALWLIESVGSWPQKFDRAGNTMIADLNLSLKLARTAETPSQTSATITKQNTQKVTQ